MEKIDDNTNWKTRIEDNILILETKLQQKEKECNDLKRQINILNNLVIEYSSTMNDETNDVSNNLKTKLTLLRLQKQYGTNILSTNTSNILKQHSTTSINKTFKKQCDKTPINQSIKPITSKQLPPDPPPQFAISSTNPNQISNTNSNQYTHKYNDMNYEKDKTWNLTEQIVKYPKELHGTQNIANQMGVVDQIAFQRADIGSVTNFLCKDVNEPVFSKQNADYMWHKLHG
eukprot:225625_1